MPRLIPHFGRAGHICECAFINQPACDVCDLYDQFCTELGCLVNHHVPIMHGIVTERPHTPWLNHDLDEMKRQVRLREREPTTTVFVTAAGFNKGCVLQS